MRLMVFFDLPVKSRASRRHYQQFHKFLVKDGYVMMQFSVYTRIVNGLDGLEKHMKRLKYNLPPKGHVRAMSITEKQYRDMDFLVGQPTMQEKKVGVQLQIRL